VPNLRRKEMFKVPMEVMLMEEWARVDRIVKLMVRKLTPPGG
jgi:hypothetical protein